MSLSDKLKGLNLSATPHFKLDPSILLCARVPKPMHGTAPRTVLGDKWWNKERQAAYKSTGFHCAACGVHKNDAAYHQWLESHETYEIDYVKGICKYVKSIPLCNFCHNYIHSGRLQALLERGEIHHAKYVAIIQHGDRILAAAGLVKPPPYEGPIAEWSSWRLVIGRKRYKGKFPTIQDWCAAFGRDPAVVLAQDWFNFK